MGGGEGFLNPQGRKSVVSGSIYATEIQHPNSNDTSCSYVSSKLNYKKAVLSQRCQRDAQSDNTHMV